MSFTWISEWLCSTFTNIHYKMFVKIKCSFLLYRMQERTIAHSTYQLNY